jgi:Tol biopolymer transport system component
MAKLRWVTYFVLLAFCLAPLDGWGQVWAVGWMADNAQRTIDASAREATYIAQPHPCRLDLSSTTLVSLASGGTQMGGDSSKPSISADGRFIAFEYAATNKDIFISDRLSGEIQLVSVGLNGNPGDDYSRSPSISADGRFVVFSSDATNLVAGDSNNAGDIFIRDVRSGETVRASVASDGTQGNDWSSYEASISADGRFVVFSSGATNLVAGDTNGWGDIFIHDMLSGETVRVSLATDGAQGDGHSTDPAISADGRYVAFTSEASNLVSGDTNEAWDVFVHDLQSGETERVSVASDGTQANTGTSLFDPASISGDGRWVVFESAASNLVSGDTNGVRDIFVHDRQRGETRRVSVASDGTQANGDSFNSTISADGRWVSFGSEANNLVSGDTNGRDDIFLHDLQSGKTERVSLAWDGSQGEYYSLASSLSADGRFVAFDSRAKNLVIRDHNGTWDVFVRDRGPQGPTVQASFGAAPLGGLAPLAVTFANRTAGDFTSSLWDFGDGITSTLPSPTHTYAAPGAYTVTLTASGAGGTDTLACAGYVVAYDRLGSQERASLASDGSQGDHVSRAPVTSADGRYVAFESNASNLVSGDTNGVQDIFVHDRQTGETVRVSVASDGTQGNDNSYAPSISADGQLVAFGSRANNLVAGDTNGYPDIFVHDLRSGKTELVSLASDGTHGNYDSYAPALSADGRYVAFESWADNLVAGKPNDEKDIFIHDRLSGKTERVSVASDGTLSNSYSASPSVSADGRLVAFFSYSDNLVEEDTNRVRDVFVHDCQSGETKRVSVSSDGTQANGSSYDLLISANGRFVAFASDASNLVSGDTNGVSDVFVHDLQGGETVRVSLASDGRQGNSRSYDPPTISADGRFVAFTSAAYNLVNGDTNLSHDVFVHDRQSGETRRVSLAVDGAQGNDHSIEPSISADGRFVAFASAASNLAYSDTNGVADVFVQDWGIQGQPVQAGFEAAPLEGFAPLAVTFTNQTTGDGTFNLWTFGDGGSSLLPSPVYTYTAAGVYTVTLMVSGPGGMDTLVRPAYVTVQPRRFYLPLVRH